MVEFAELSDELGGRFRIIACVKKSETTGVYVAELGKKKVLLKTLYNSLVDTEIQNRFKREARILAKLNHKNIVKIVEWNFGEKISYIAYEYFESKNLRQLLREKKLNEKEKLRLVTELLEGINYLHKNDVIHRDLKPDNILIDKNLNLKITDFGLSFLHNDEFTTQNYAIVGTPGYMSPEQIQGKRSTVQSDLFSLGIIIYEIYVGKNPFIGEDFNQTLNNILNFNPEKLKTVREYFPPNVYNVLTLLLEVDLELRAKSAEEVLKILAGSKPIIRIKKIRKNVRLLIAVLTVIFLSGVYYIANYSREEKHFASEIVKNEIPVKRNKVLSENEKTPTPEEKPSEASKNNSGEKKIVTAVEPGANKSASAKPKKKVVPKIKTKEIVFTSYPWADIILDGKELGVTPFEKPVPIPYGKHRLVIKNPYYPEIEREFVVGDKTPENINFNLADEFGYLSCTVFPWGNVYLDSNFIGQTPIRDVIAISPGEYTLTVENPNFATFRKKIKIEPKDTFRIHVNFTEINLKN